jgi:uncharacterized membrane protein
MTTSSVTTRTVPRWAAPASLVVCVLGLLDSLYLTYEHYTASQTLACSESATINCLKVTTSSYAQVLGVPVSNFGVLFFVVMTVLCLPALWRRANPQLQMLRVVAAGVGVLSVFYLVWVELFRLDAICLWCTGVHVLTLALFGIVVVATALTESEPEV